MITSRFSEPAFRIYEPFLTEVVRAYPKCIVITKADCDRIHKSPETVRGRIRDSLKAYITNRWPSTISQSIFDSIPDPYKELKARLMPDETILAGRDEEQIAQSTGFSFQAPAPKDQIFELVHRSELMLVCCLCEAGLIPTGVKISGTAITPEAINHFETTSDVTFSKLEDNVYILR